MQKSNVFLNNVFKNYNLDVRCSETSNNAYILPTSWDIIIRFFSYSAILFTLLFTFQVNAQWQHLNVFKASTIYNVNSNGSNIIASSNNGVFISSDSGATWNFNNISGAVCGVTSSSFVDSTIYISGYTGGYYYSNDNGANWSIGNYTLYYVKIRTIYKKNNILIAGTDHGIYLSNDNGTNWTLSNTSLPNNIDINSVIVKDTTIYAGTNKGVYISNNNGLNWALCNNGIPNISVNTLVLNNTTLYAGTDSGIYKVANNSNNWTKINNGTNLNNIISIIFKDTIIMSASKYYGIYTSNNNGSTWFESNNGFTNTTINSLSIYGSKILCGTQFSGLFESTDNGASWSSVDINSTYCDNFIKLASHNSVIYGATGYNGVFVSKDNGNTWSSINKGLPVNIYVSSIAANDSTLFLGTNIGLYTLKLDGVSQWISCFTQPYTISSIFIKDSIVAVGTGPDLFCSTNNGKNWINLMNPNFSNNIWNITIIDSTLYLQTDISIIKIFLNGQYWTNLGQHLPSTCFDPKLLGVSNNYKIYINEDFYDSTYTSSNNGMSWDALKIGFPVHDLAFKDNNTFIATDNGVYLSKDNGINWQQINTGFPYLWTETFTINDRYIYVTNANGIWRRLLSEIVGIEEPKLLGIETLKAFPNPATNQTTISYTQLINEGELQIYNTLGQLVYEEKLASGSSQKEINIESFKAGLYKVVVRQNGMLKGQVGLIKN